MKGLLSDLAKEYKAQTKSDGDCPSLGLGEVGLNAFYSAIGISQPVCADLSANIVKAYQGHVIKNLHPAYSSLSLLDTQRFLLFLFQKGAIRVDYSSLIKVDLQAACTNDFAAYEQHPRWKN